MDSTGLVLTVAKYILSLRSESTKLRGTRLPVRRLTMVRRSSPDDVSW